MPAKAAPPHTKAWMALEENLDIISHMVHLGSRDINRTNATLGRVAEALRQVKEIDFSGGRAERAKAARLLRGLAPRLETAQVGMDRVHAATLWQVVMLVTCIEAYLQDLLAAAASVDPELMSKSEQTARYADVVSATSLDELANELRRRWARGVLGDGGPTRWMDRLRKMGAKDYPVDLAPRLELIWGIRHVVVHTAGVADADFLKWHPDAARAVGDRVHVDGEQYTEFREAARAFLERTERFFLARYPSLTAT